MSLGYPNQNGGRTTDAALFHGLGNIFTGTWISGFRVRQNSPLGMSVQIGGESTVPDDLLVRDGTGAVFPVFNMSSQPVVATVPAANSANPRIDTVVVYIDNSIAADHASENNQNRTKVIVIAGAPATNPSAPSASQIKSVIGSNNPYTVLADIRVNRGATSIGNSNITDRRWAVKLRHSPIIDNAWQLKNDIVLPRHINNDGIAKILYSESPYRDLNTQYALVESGQISITKPGDYLLMASFQQQAWKNGTGADVSLSIHKNSSVVDRASFNTSNWHFGFVQKKVSLAAGDKIKCAAQVQQAVSMSLSARLSAMPISCLTS